MRLTQGGITARHGWSCRYPKRIADGDTAFQVFSSMAELDRSNIILRTSAGRDRCAADGLWTGGVLPFGYDVEYADASTNSRRRAGRLALTDRLVPELGMR